MSCKLQNQDKRLLQQSLQSSNSLIKDRTAPRTHGCDLKQTELFAASLSQVFLFLHL